MKLLASHFPENRRPLFGAMLWSKMRDFEKSRILFQAIVVASHFAENRCPLFGAML
ncbi:MAG: hypothetical protein KGK11_02920 [Sphingomonadales bacterium]|nr:hypothetical protein [Sphingomonadales bacterium]